VGRHKYQWEDDVRNDLRKMKLIKWAEQVQDRLKWKDIVERVSRRHLQKKLGCWLVNQDGAQWRGLGDTQRQAREFISGPSLCTRAKFFTFNPLAPELFF
jgi:hypothetical protein